MQAKIIFLISFGIFLFSLFYVAYELTQPDPGKIVLPGGTTYLGTNE